MASGLSEMCVSQGSPRFEGDPMDPDKRQLRKLKRDIKRPEPSAAARHTLDFARFLVRDFDCRFIMDGSDHPELPELTTVFLFSPCYDAPQKEIAMIELTEEQRKQLAGAVPVIIDPQTHEEYVLVSKHVYQKLQGQLDDDARLMYPMLADLDAEDWEDASIYQDKP
jgi:hypothetical protein